MINIPLKMPSSCLALTAPGCTPPLRRNTHFWSSLTRWSYHLIFLTMLTMVSLFGLVFSWLCWSSFLQDRVPAKRFFHPLGFHAWDKLNNQYQGILCFGWIWPYIKLFNDQYPWNPDEPNDQPQDPPCQGSFALMRCFSDRYLFFSDKYQLPGWLESSPFALPVRAPLQGLNIFSDTPLPSFDNIFGRSQVEQWLSSTAASQVTK